MAKNPKVLALIPARGGSKGLPGKNIRSFAGHPLIAHSIFMAKMCPLIKQIIVSTDDPKIAEVAKDYGAEVPFLRPKALAQDNTPMWPVVRHTLQSMENLGKEYDYVLLLDPTSPGRTSQDVKEAFNKLKKKPDASGIIGVSQSGFNPIWHCVVEKEGWMTNLIEEGSRYQRRQDVPIVYRINASLYIWRTEFVRRSEENNWRKAGKHLFYEIPESRAIHIDDLHEFQVAELLVKANLISFPWIR